MKGAIVLLFALVLLFISATYLHRPTDVEYTVVVIDHCEYIVATPKGAGISTPRSICHKGNCKYCAERKKKENGTE